MGKIDILRGMVAASIEKRYRPTLFREALPALSCWRVLSKFVSCALLLCIVETVHFKTALAQLRTDATDAAVDNVPLDLNLRLVWGGSKEVSYSGTIELDVGVLTGTQQLGIDLNDPSFILKNSDGRLVVQDASTRFGGVDIRVQSKSNAKLKMQLQAVDPNTSETVNKEYTWSLKSLRDNLDVKELGLNDCRLSVDRVPGDRLRVVSSRSHLIYNSDEPLSMQIHPYALPWVSSTTVLECTLVRLDDEQTISRKSKMIVLDAYGNGEPYDVFSNAPREEGVYELRIKCEPKRLLPGLIIKQASVERTVQFVVYNNLPSNRSKMARASRDEIGTNESEDWHRHATIPLKSFESQSLTSRLASQIEGSKRFPFFEIAKSLSFISKEADSNATLDAEGTTMQLRPNSIATTALGNLEPGKLHRLTVSTPSNSAAFRVAISLLKAQEQKTNGLTIANEVFDVPPTRAIDRVTSNDLSHAQESYQLLFWPTSRFARIEITNLNAVNSLSIGDSTVDLWQPQNQELDTNSGDANRKRNVLELQSTNVRGMFPSEPTNSGAKDSPIYDDWRLFLRFANQLGSYCKANGFESLAMTVNAQGGSLFPSRKLSSNARFDTGTFSNDARDPMRKDIVELMYRVMARSGVEFVPMLEISSPLQEIEEWLVRTDDRDLVQTREDSNIGLGPNDRLYNPLSSRVQLAISTALDEFEGRYRSHLGYRGFALRIADHSHLDLTLPVDQTNTSIVDRFVGSMTGNLPKDRAQREEFITQRLQAAHTQWGQSSIIAFLSKLKNEPRWVSVDREILANEGQTLSVVSPIQIGGPQNLDLSEVKSTIARQWTFDSPRPVHAAMERPSFRFDTSFARLSRVAGPFEIESSNSLPYRDNSRTVSKVRIWENWTENQSLLLSNSGAGTETVRLAWDRLPENYRLISTFEPATAIAESRPNSRIETDSAAREWQLKIAAGEVIRIDVWSGAPKPMYWYSDEAATLRTLDIAIRSLEQAVTRLSIPQPRVATLTNANFEAANASVRRGRLSGWTTSIDPNAPVETDSRINSGNTCIRMESSNLSSVAWIQSDPFALTPSDKLFVSLLTAAEQVPQQVSLTLSKFDPNTDRFETIAVRDLADRIARLKETSAWGNVGIDLSSEFQIASQGSEASLYRLQVELKGLGRIWIDDVSLSTSFLRAEEQRDLRTELFLARTSLQNGDSGPAVSMLIAQRGRLVQWADASVADRKVMVSVRGDVSLPTNPQPSTIEKRKVGDVNSENKGAEPKGPEARVGLVKRWRNYWGQRKEER